MHFRLGGDQDALSLTVRDRYGWPEDIVAWLKGQPGKWFLHDGNNIPILGAKQLAGAEYAGFPLTVYPTPLAWAEDEGDGVVILAGGVNLIHLFDGLTLDLGHLPSATALELGQRLRDNFRSYEPAIVGLGGGWL
ncbi:MAG: hypothetical protein O6831_00760 [Alphaproteobacteria bacterium]|nr:hypothetical protein [Alphaproteobacteria bacterium]